MPQTHRLRVVCVGHSFTKRLANYCESGRENLGLDIRRHHISFIGQGGKLYIHLYGDIPALVRLNPDIVCIDIGSNDIDNDMSCAQQLASNVFHFASYLIEAFRIKTVVIMEVLCRLEEGRYGTHNKAQFQHAARMYNYAIKRLVNSQSSKRQIYFWHHRGLVHNWERYIDNSDGVHLNQAGMHKYYRSFRSCIIHHSSKLLG